MSCRNSSASWNSPPVLPLGMRLTELKTRDTGCSSDIFADFQNENEPEVDSLNLNSAFSRFSSEQIPNEWHDCAIDEPPSKQNCPTIDLSKSTNPRVARIQEFVKKYNIDLSKKLKHNSKPLLQNSKCRNKVLHYYNLLRVPKKEDAEHPDIVKFRRFYGLRRPLSLSASQHEATFNFRPNVRPSLGLEEPKNFLGPKIPSPTNPEYKSPYFAPLASLENCADSDNLLRVRKQREHNRARFERDYPTIVDLIEYNNNGFVNDSSFQQKPASSKYYQHTPYSPKMSCSVAGTSTNTKKSPYFADSPLGFSQNLPDLPENNVFAQKEASVTCSYTSSVRPIDDSSLVSSNAHLAEDFQPIYQCSSCLPESNYLSQIQAFTLDGCIFSGIGNGTKIRTNCGYPRITDLDSEDHCGNVTISANISPPHIAESQNIFIRMGSKAPENDAQTGNPTFYTRSQCEIENVNSSFSHSFVKYAVEDSTSLFKYCRVPAEKYSVTENKASASKEKNMNWLIASAPFYSNASARDSETEAESDKIAITDECSRTRDENSESSFDLGHSLDKNPATAKLSSSPDSFMEEISFSPDEEDSDADVRQNAVLNVRMVETSLCKIFSDSSCSSSVSDC